MDIKTLLSSLEAPDSPPGLVRGVLQRIEQEQLIGLRRSAVILSMSAVVSCVVFVESVNMIAVEFVQSGFTALASLLFSDTDALIAGGSSSFFALLESFPFLYVSFTFAAITAFVSIVTLFWRDIRKIIHFSYSQTRHSL